MPRSATSEVAPHIAQSGENDRQHQAPVAQRERGDWFLRVTQDALLPEPLLDASAMKPPTAEPSIADSPGKLAGVLPTE